jgi:hypothetical protein
VDEDVCSAVLTLNEAVTLRVVKPLDHTGHPLVFPSCKPKTC